MSNSKIHPFDPVNCDIKTQILWEPWATVPVLKIVTLLLTRKGGSIYSTEGIGVMCGLPKSTVIHALKLLRDNGYVVKEGGHYYLSLGRISDQSIGQPTNGLVASTNPLVNSDQSIGQNSTNPLVANNNKEIIIKNNNKEIGEGPSLDAQDLEFLTLAEVSLEPATTDTIQNDILYMNLGRRPMKRYKAIWLTPTELAETLALYRDKGIPIDDRKLFRHGFKIVSEEISDPSNGGPDRKRSKALKYLSTFGLTETLNLLKAENDLKRSSAYLDSAKQPKSNGIQNTPKEFVPAWVNDKPPDVQEVEDARAKIRAMTKR